MPGLAFQGENGRARSVVEMDEPPDAAAAVDDRRAPLAHELELRVAPLVPEPVQQPRPPLMVAANGRKALRLAAGYGDAALSLGDDGSTMEDALAAVRERNALLDEYCADRGRDPATLERAYFVGWAEEFRSPQQRRSATSWVGIEIPAWAGFSSSSEATTERDV